MLVGEAGATHTLAAAVWPRETFPAGVSQAQRVVVISLLDGDLGSGTNAQFLQEFSQLAIAFVHALYRIAASSQGLGEQQQSTLALQVGMFGSRRIAMRTRPSAAQFAREQCLKIAGDSMLQTLGFIVHLVPRHAEDFVQHALDEVMTNRQPTGNLAAFAGELYSSILTDRHQPITLQTAQCHGYSWR